MPSFLFSASQASQQYIKISVQFRTENSETKIQLPRWRPGRYELANFAKNVKSLVVYDPDKKTLPVEKDSIDRWVVDTSNCSNITVEYAYYANKINAGSSFLDANQLYINPVNCCVFTEETYNSKVEVVLDIPEKWSVATSMERTKLGFEVENFDELMDSPLIASGILQHEEFDVNNIKFHIWFNGEVKPDWDRLIKDFKAFTEAQINSFTEFPVEEYHFLFQIVPYKAYHGVEHQKSTVIYLGPSYDVFNENYKELLGVSSHELYHTWNVKAIRPVEMYPYDFTKENYSRLGYLCEGVTTYQGDLFLLKSGVFSEEQYFVEFNKQLQKHFDNHGRFNYSVAASSFDTWLDGYEVGAPNRKVSIYTEGCLLAFVTDIRIREATKNKYGLDEVMKRLYFNFAMKEKGVSEADYQKTIEQVAGHSFQDFFDDYINGTKSYESILIDSLNYLGLELIHKPSSVYAESRLGMRTASAGNTISVTGLYPGGPAEVADAILGDKIIAVNDIACNMELDKWLSYFDNDSKTITVNRSGVLKKLTFPEVNRNFYMEYSVEKRGNSSSDQKNAFLKWSK